MFSSPLTIIRLKTTKEKNKQWMETMIVATSLPTRPRTTATTTIPRLMVTTITTTFNETTLIMWDSMIAGLREVKLSKNKKVKVRFLTGAKTEDLMFHLITKI